MKRVEGGVLGEVREVRVGGRWPTGRPRKKWNDCVMEDMNFLGVGEYVVQDQQMWRAIITHPTPS